MDQKTLKLIKDLRALSKVIEDSQSAVIEQFSNGVDFEKQFAHMIETYPEVWGKGGSMRPWLNRYAEENGIDGDFGLTNDNSPYNE